VREATLPVRDAGAARPSPKGG